MQQQNWVAWLACERCEVAWETTGHTGGECGLWVLAAKYAPGALTPQRCLRLWIRSTGSMTHRPFSTQVTPGLGSVASMLAAFQLQVVKEVVARVGSVAIGIRWTRATLRHIATRASTFHMREELSHSAPAPPRAKTPSNSL